MITRVGESIVTDATGSEKSNLQGWLGTSLLAFRHKKIKACVKSKFSKL